jgi:hypothetical protein
VSLSTSFLTSGSISKLVGNPTISPIVHPIRKPCKKNVVQPIIIVVIVKVIVESRAKVMKVAVSKVEYFLFTNEATFMKD